MERFERTTLLESRQAARSWRAACIFALLVWVLIAWALSVFSPNKPVTYLDDLEHFYFGSIGSETSAGVPTKILRVLPSVFTEHLPPGGVDYTAFGFLRIDSTSPLPIGFSTRRRIVDLSSINCAACHVGAVRTGADEAAVIVPGMPSNTVDLLGFFDFLFRCAADHRFNAETLVAAMEQAGLLNRFEKLIYPSIIERTREGLLDRRSKLAFLFEPGYPTFGPGRVNTFDTFKFDQFHPIYERFGETIEDDETYGVVAFPAVWNQAPRDGLRLHWDGNNTSVRERNFSAAIGAGARPQDMDVDSLYRIEDWLRELPPPEFPFSIDPVLARQGEKIYRQYCFDCHDFDGDRVGTVIALEEIATDPSRLYSYTEFIRRAQRIYTAGYDWRFRHFMKTDGYAAQPLDGIWARAPYLHNGSVPSLWDLLLPADRRPRQFLVGGDRYDPKVLGFVTAPAMNAFSFDTGVRGNSNEGHSGVRYGTELSEPDKWALIEYLKTVGSSRQTPQAQSLP